MTDRLLKSLLATFERTNASTRRSLQLSANEFLVLFHLWMRDEDGMTMGEVGNLVNVTSGGLTALVDRLERGGHVVRVPDEQDRRRIKLTATDKAASTRDAFLKLFDDADASVRDLPADQQAAVRGWLDRVTRRLAELS